MSKNPELRPVDDALFQEVLPLIADGQTLRALSREMNFAPSSFRYWVMADKERVRAYESARLMQAESWADDIIHIAHDDSQDTITIKDSAGNDKDVENKEWMNRSKLKIDTAKWIMARNHPKRFGDKIEQTLTGPDNSPIKFSIAIDRVNSVDSDTGSG